MILKCLFAQRKKRYEKEFMPEILVAIDQYTDEENPDFFTKESDRQLNLMGSDCIGKAVILIHLGDVEDEIIRRCLGSGGVIRGVIAGDK